DSTRRDRLPRAAPAPPDAAGDGLAPCVIVTDLARAHRRGASRRCPRLPPGETGSSAPVASRTPAVNLRDGATTSHEPSWLAGNDAASPVEHQGAASDGTHPPTPVRGQWIVNGDDSLTET